MQEFGVPEDKSMGDLGREALWFTAHTLIAVVVLLIVIVAMAFFRPDPNATGPKLVAMALSLLVPMIVAFLITRQTRNQIGPYVWISALIVFVAACVWVIDLQTGPGLCQQCGPGHLMERIWRTFFSIDNGSGLLGGQGVVVGCWLPLSLVGYAIGSRLGLEK